MPKTVDLPDHEMGVYAFTLRGIDLEHQIRPDALPVMPIVEHRYESSPRSRALSALRR